VRYVGIHDNPHLPEDIRREFARLREAQGQPGLGDMVQAATTAAGVQPCGRCKRARDALNRMTPSWVRRWLSALGLRPAGRQPNHHVQHDGKRQDRQAPLKSQDA